MRDIAIEETDFEVVETWITAPHTGTPSVGLASIDGEEQSFVLLGEQGRNRLYDLLPSVTPDKEFQELTPTPEELKGYLYSLGQPTVALVVPAGES